MTNLNAPLKAYATGWPRRPVTGAGQPRQRPAKLELAGLGRGSSLADLASLELASLGRGSTSPDSVRSSSPEAGKLESHQIGEAGASPVVSHRPRRPAIGQK
ncbi:hypothetical protein NL676_010982 [Syzygium grande]|nr:hypothetical protein NL676_010982 [Syzygium grande]